MKKSTLILLILTITNYSNLFAQNWAKKVYGGGGTNLYKGFTFDKDNNPVIMGTVKDAVGGKPNGFVFVKMDKVTGNNVILKKYDGDNETDCFKMFTDEQGGMYFIGSFKNYIAFDTDTFKTYYNRVQGNSNVFIAKFDNEGNHIWHVKVGGTGSAGVGNILDAHLQDGKIHLMMQLGSDSIFHNDTLVGKLPSHSTYERNFGLFTTNLTDGSFDKFLFVGKYYYTNPIMFNIMPDNTYLLGSLNEGGAIGTIPLLSVHAFNINSPQLTLKCSTTYAEPAKFKGSNLKTMHYLNGSYYLLTYNNTTTTDGGGVYGTDTILNLPTQHQLRGAALIKFDTTLKITSYKRLQWYAKYPELTVDQNKLLVPIKFIKTIYTENDSMVSRNGNTSWTVMAFNPDLSVSDSFQINTINSGTGSFDLNYTTYDKAGNLYCQVTHGKTVDYYGTILAADSKSWDHLTVIARKGDNLNSGIQKNNAATIVSVYPNPVSDNLTITQPIIEGSVQTLTGKTLLKFNAQTIDVSQLPAGIYFLNAIGKDGVYYAKFIKN